MFYSRFTCLVAFVWWCYVTTTSSSSSVGNARTRDNSLELTGKSDVGGEGVRRPSVNTLIRRKQTERRPSQHRHSTRVDRNRPPIVLLPPWFGDERVIETRRMMTTPTTTTTSTSAPFIIRVPYEENIVQNDTEQTFDVRVPVEYLAPPLVDAISQYQLAPDPEEPQVSITESAYSPSSTITTEMVTAVASSNDRTPSSDVNCTLSTPCNDLDLTHYTLSPNVVDTTPVTTPDNDLSPRLIAAESGDVRNSRYRHRKRHRENLLSSNTVNKTPRMQHEHPRHVCTQKGYVADISSGCRVFHICVDNGVGESMSCPNGTLFNKDFSVCDWWYNVDCK